MTPLPALPCLLPSLWEGFMLAVVHHSGTIESVNPHLAHALGHEPARVHP